MMKEAEKIIDAHNECELNIVTAPQNALQNDCNEQSPSTFSHSAGEMGAVVSNC